VSWARPQLLAHQLEHQFQATAKYKALVEPWEAQQVENQKMRKIWPARLLRYLIPNYPTAPRAITYLIQRRAEALNASSKGKLASQLAAQKAQTQSQTLNSASQVERDTRNADSAAEARQWN
jgi:ABC-type Na+ efflux pump permease subunit